MDRSQLAAINDLATAVRRLAEEELKGSHIGFHDFPNGSCKHTSAILQAVLSDACLGNWIHCNGENLPVDSHTWLELDGWFLDPTLDQYEGYEEKVYLSQGVHPRKALYPKVGVIPPSWANQDSSVKAALNKVREKLEIRQP